MNEEPMLESIQRRLLLRSIYVLVAPLFMIFVALACGTVITDTATFTCPTAVPEPGEPIIPPVSISAPQDFYVDDAVFVGQPGAPLRLRFRLQTVQVQAAGSGQRVMWRLEIHNLGTIPYETIPAALMVITRITTASGEQTGIWRTSEAAMNAAGFTGENYDPLPPGSTRVYRLAAYIPTGSPSQFTYLLDGDGGNRITWVNQRNPYCPEAEGA